MGCGASTVAVQQQPPTEASKLVNQPDSVAQDKLKSEASKDKARPGSGPSQNGSDDDEGEDGSNEGSEEDSDLRSMFHLRCKVSQVCIQGEDGSDEDSEDESEDELQPHVSESQPSGLRQKSSVKEMFMAGVAGLKSFSSQMMKSFKTVAPVTEVSPPAKKERQPWQEPSAKERRAQAAAKLELKRQQEEQQQWERTQAGDQGMYGLQQEPYSPQGGINKPRARCQSALPFRSTPTMPTQAGFGGLPPIPGAQPNHMGMMAGMGAMLPGRRNSSGNGAFAAVGPQSQNGVLPPIHNSNRGTPMVTPAGFLQPLGAMPAGYDDPFARPSAAYGRPSGRPSSAMPVGGTNYKGLTQFDPNMDYMSLLKLTNKPAATTTTSSPGYASSPSPQPGLSQFGSPGLTGAGFGAPRGTSGPGAATAASSNDPWAMLAQLKA